METFSHFSEDCEKSKTVNEGELTGSQALSHGALLVV